MKALGYDLSRVAQRVAEIYEMELHEIFSKGRILQKGVTKEYFYDDLEEVGRGILAKMSKNTLKYRNTSAIFQA